VVLVSVDTIHGIPVPTLIHGLTHLSLCNLPIEHSREEEIYASNRVWSLILELFRI